MKNGPRTIDGKPLQESLMVTVTDLNTKRTEIHPAAGIFVKNKSEVMLKCLFVADGYAEVTIHLHLEQLTKKQGEIETWYSSKSIANLGHWTEGMKFKMARIESKK